MPLSGVRLIQGFWSPFYGGGLPFDATIQPGVGVDAAREALVTKTYWPEGGVTAGLMPSQSRGALTVQGVTSYAVDNSAGVRVVIRDRKFTGKVSVTGKNYLFKNCWFAAGGVTQFECSGASASDIVVEDCLFEPDVSVANSFGLMGHSVTVRRCWFRYLVDTTRPYRSGGGNLNFWMHDSVQEDFVMFSPDPNHADNSSHPDANQIQGGWNINYHNNWINNIYTTTRGQGGDPAVKDAGTGAHLSGNPTFPSLAGYSCFMFAPNLSVIGPMEFDRNYLNGGAVCFNLAGYLTTQAPGDIKIRNNRWGRQMRLGDTFTILRKSALDPYLDVTGNVYFDTGASFNVRSNG